MDHARSPRRAVLLGDSAASHWRLARSAGWPTEQAALQVVGPPSGSKHELEGDGIAFLRLWSGEWAFVRSGVSRASDGGRHSWREAIVVDNDAFVRQRNNPFRLLPEAAPELSDASNPELAAPAPVLATHADDQARLDSLRVALPPGERDHLPTLFAALLDAEHTLLTGELPQLPRRLELLGLLLPPSIRRELTFQIGTAGIDSSQARRPRLLVRRMQDAAEPEREGEDWGHRLPDSADTTTHAALDVSRALLDMLDQPARLAAAHAEFERRTSNHEVATASRLLDAAAEVVRLSNAPAVAAARTPGSGTDPTSHREEPDARVTVGGHERSRRAAMAVALAGGLGVGAGGGYLLMQSLSFPAAEATAVNVASPRPAYETLPSIGRVELAARLAQAQALIAADDWPGLVDLLAAATVDPSVPGAFTWDSLLAQGARLQAEWVGSDQRIAMLELARSRATRALEAIPAFTTQADDMRLLRADACISGPLSCDAAAIATDLVLSARSSSPHVSRRARELLAIHSR